MPKTLKDSLAVETASNDEADATMGEREASPVANADSKSIISAINELKTDLKGDNESLRRELNTLGQEINSKLDGLATDVQSLNDRVGEVEARVETVEIWAAEASEALASCLEQRRSMQLKLTDLESRSRRNNLRIFGVAEGEEGNSVPQFIDKFLRSKLPIPMGEDLKIQRAHRSLAQKPRPEAPPRPIIINFQEYTTKEMVLREAWKKGSIKIGDRSIYFDHDYATEIVKKRREYNGIKKALKQRGVRFQTPYTSMRIHWDTGVRSYSSAREAYRELKSRGITVEGPEPTEDMNSGDARLRGLLGWQQAAGRRDRGPAERARDKLLEFRRRAEHT